MKDCPHNFIKRNYYSLTQEPQFIPEKNRKENIPIIGNGLLGIMEQELEVSDSFPEVTWRRQLSRVKSR